MLATNSKVERRLARLKKLDFTDIKAKLCALMGWTPEKAEVIEKWYRRFLQITLLHPDGDHVPCADVDHFWHSHILDTKRYMRDCQAVFGHYIHHVPSYGNGSILGGYAETNALLLQVFGEDQTSIEDSVPICSGTCRECKHKCRKGTCKKK